MPTAAECQIIAAEERLRLAMLDSDLVTLDELISSDLIFTNYMGQVVGKPEDLGLHWSGVLKFRALEPAEQKVKTDGQFAVVSVRMRVSGLYDGSPFAGDFRYTRIWRHLSGNAWQVVAGHFSAVQQ